VKCVPYFGRIGGGLGLQDASRCTWLGDHVSKWCLVLIFRVGLLRGSARMTLNWGMGCFSRSQVACSTAPHNTRYGIWEYLKRSVFFSDVVIGCSPRVCGAIIPETLKTLRLGTGCGSSGLVCCCHSSVVVCGLGGLSTANCI